jgi:hypothetical protein
MPSTWTTGSFSGIKARGGFEVGVTWAKSRATSIQVKSLNGTSAKLSYPNIAGAIVTNQAGQNVAYATNHFTHVPHAGSVPGQEGNRPGDVAKWCRYRDVVKRINSLRIRE